MKKINNNYYIGFIFGLLNFVGSSKMGSKFTRGWFDGALFFHRRKNKK